MAAIILGRPIGTVAIGEIEARVLSTNAGGIAVTGGALSSLEGIARLSSPYIQHILGRLSFHLIEFLDFARVFIYFRLSLPTFSGRIILVLATREHHCRQGRLDRSSY